VCIACALRSIYAIVISDCEVRDATRCRRARERNWVT
jgi:hypothetical protein